MIEKKRENERQQQLQQRQLQQQQLQQQQQIQQLDKNKQELDELQKQLDSLPEDTQSLNKNTLKNPLSLPPVTDLQTFTVDDIVYVILENGTCAIIDNNINTPNTSINVSCVENLGKNYKVIAVYDMAFNSNSNIVSVTLPECKTVSYQSFYNCSNLTTVSFPKCQSISDSAFSQCALTTVSFPKCQTIDQFAFYQCLLTTVSFPKCQTIGQYAFSGCALTTVSFPECQTIGQYAFTGCALTTISFPICKYFGEYAFEYCNISYLTIPETVEYIGNDTFGDNPLVCVNFKGSYDIIVGATPFLSYNNNIHNTIECIHVSDKCNIQKYAEVLQLPTVLFKTDKKCCYCNITQSSLNDENIVSMCPLLNCKC